MSTARCDRAIWDGRDATTSQSEISDVGTGLHKVLHPLSQAPGSLLRARELGTEIGWDRSRLSHHLTRSAV
jgi:hypothetical protein